MTYTPVELRHVRVGRSLLGYNRAVVEELIEEVAQSFEATWRERGDLADRVEALEKQIAEHRRREDLLTHTLVAAEQTANNVRDQARRAAEAILADAQRDARSILREAETQRERLVLETRRIEGMLRAALVLVEPIAQVPVSSLKPPAPTDAVEEPWPTHATPPAPQPMPESLDSDPDGWSVDDTSVFEPVRLPRIEPVDEAPDAAAESASTGSPFLRRLAGGSSGEFNWGD
jgi:cell division initiation protein